MASWNPLRLQEQLKHHERRKQAAADRCQTRIRFGKPDYEHFYDEEIAEEMVAFVLSTDAALESRDRFLERLTELRKQTEEGGLDASGIHSAETFRTAAIRYIDRLAARFGDLSHPPDTRST